MVVEAIDGVMRRIRRLEALEYSRSKSDGNILTNPGFEIWQRGTGPFIANGYTADRWYINGTGATISVAPNITVPDGSMLSARLVFTPGASTAARLYQYIENGDQYHGLTVGFTAKVNASVANNARLFIKDDAVYEYSQYHSGVAGWEDLSVARLLSAGISSLSFGLELGPLACTVYIDNACVMVGTVALFTPRHPSDDWDRCLRYYETGHLCWRGYTPDDHGIWLPLTFVERKCEIPTITMSGGVYDVYGTVLTDTLVALDENTMCWQLSSTGVGIGEVADRHWIAEANCEPIPGLLYFSSGYDLGTGIDELWKYDGTTTSLVWSALDYASITCLFYNNIDGNMYMCTWYGDHDISIYRIDPDDTVTEILSWDADDQDPAVDVAIFNNEVYIYFNGYLGYAQVRKFDPVAATCTLVYSGDAGDVAGGIAVDPVANELVMFDGSIAYHSADGTTWNVDKDLATDFDGYSGFSLITYNNHIYASLQTNVPDGNGTIIRRDGLANWVVEQVGPYPGHTNVACTYTAKFNPSTGVEESLFAQLWGWFFADEFGSIMVRDLAGVWTEEWTGPLSSGGLGQGGLWAQALAQFNGKIYGLWLNRNDWGTTGLYERDDIGNWTLVKDFANHGAIGTYPYTMAIAAANNTLKLPHEV